MRGRCIRWTNGRGSESDISGHSILCCGLSLIVKNMSLKSVVRYRPRTQTPNRRMEFQNIRESVGIEGLGLGLGEVKKRRWSRQEGEGGKGILV